MRKRTLAIAVGFVVSGGTLGSAGEDGDRTKVPDILEFKTMVGVSAPYTGSANPIRNVAGGGLPWVLESAKGELRADGKLELSVSGLVIDPTAASAAAGTNPAPQFRAIVSCLSKDASGGPTTVNVATDPFDATTGPASTGGGVATVETFVSLPAPCVAPLVFVTNTSLRWFAATGR